MATKTSLLGLTKPAYTEAADIAVLNTNFDLIDKAVGNRTRVHNLLANSWFVNPVNSQGAASYKGESNKNTYTIDRWFFSYDSAAELTVGSGYIQKNEHKFWQRPEGIDTSKMYTGAICLTNGTVYVYSGTFSDGFGAWDKTLWCGVTSGHAYFRIETGMTEPVKWAALYEGAYDAETLPEYVVPDKRAEMIRCDVPLNPRNLLDNSYFRAGSAIAQAGVNGTHGSTKYPLDRWISWDKDITQSDNYITIGSPIDQYIESYKIDPSAVYTAAVCFADGTRQIVFGNFTTGFGSKATGCLYCATASSGKPYVRMQTGFNICWVALYEGKYDADTLPEYHYNGYAAELAECQRYYENSWFGGNTTRQSQTMGYAVDSNRLDSYVYFKQSKRVAPTVTLSPYNPGTYTNWIYYNGAYKEASTMTTVARGGNIGFMVRLTSASGDALTKGSCYAMDGHWEASADL